MNQSSLKHTVSLQNDESVLKPEKHQSPSQKLIASSATIKFNRVEGSTKYTLCSIKLNYRTIG